MSGISASAINTGFSTQELSEKDYVTFTENFSIKLITEEPSKKAVSCFDVNEQGLLAIGCGNNENKTICIYNDGEFIYGYEFYSNGSFGIEWDNENLNIYFVRSDIIASVTKDGDIVEVRMVENTLDNNSYFNNYLLSTEKVINNTNYVIKNDLGLFDTITRAYSKVVLVSQEQVETVIYDASTNYVSKILITFIFILLFVLIVVLIVIRSFRGQGTVLCLDN